MPEPVADPLAAPTAGGPGPTGPTRPPDLRTSAIPPTLAAVETSATRRLGLLGWFSILWLSGIALLAVVAPWLPLPDPDKSYLEIVRVGPVQSGHPLGGDGSGRDMLARVIFGARASLGISVSAVLIGFVVGGVLGLLAGYFRGTVDGVLTTAFNVLLSIPALVLALSLVAIFAGAQQDVSNLRKSMVLVVALAIVTVPLIGRIARASTMAWSEREFVKAAEVLGAGHGRILRREVLPNVLPAMVSIALLGIAVAIVAEGSLALLGVGITEVPSWGNMIAFGRADLARAPHIVAVPSIAIFLTVLALNYLGDVVRARFDVREAAL
ncbi:MAG TPA: ABC transporter permease [Acidimicrobiales bacterium]|nr:ABC transporter permease [Acidimicrobiales bacterium]